MDKKIVFDTSFIMEIIELFSFDKLKSLFREWEFLIPESVYNELKLLSRSNSFEKRNKAGVALKIIGKYDFKIVKSLHRKPDLDVIMVAKNENAVLATGDRYIRRKAKKLNVKVLYFRNSYPIID